MKYMLLVYSHEQLWTEEEWTACAIESAALCHELNALGQFHGASPLYPIATAKSVQVRHGQRLVTDGPFAETREQLGGYFIVDVPDLDQAISIAARLPAAKKGTIEIRPIRVIAGLPPDQPPTTGGVYKQFMLLCYDDEKYWQDAGEAAHFVAITEGIELTHQLAAFNQYLSAAPLHPVAVATSVRVRDNQRLVTDGPFAETREVLGGYYLVQAASIEAAIDIASKHSGARVGTVEVRQVFELNNLPGDHLGKISSSRELPAQVLQ